MNSTEVERIAALETQVTNLVTQVTGMRVEIRQSFVTQDLYKSAHEALENQVSDARVEIRTLRSRLPVWATLLMTGMGGTIGTLAATLFTTLRG